MLTWVVATVAATGLAWAGVRSVVDDVAAPLPIAAATTGQVDPSQGPPADEPSPAPTSTSEPSSTAGPEPSTTAPPDGMVKTFELDGGSATVRFSAAEVEVLSAVPAPGFDTEVEPEDRGIRVEFESDAHRSRLDVWWAGGPRHAIEERDDSGHGGGDGGDGGNRGEDDDDD